MQSGDSILYYPSIEFQNDAWVKSSLLLWDHIYRIVPRGYTPHDSVEIKKYVENDLIRSISLEPQDLRSISGNFIQFIEDIPFQPAGLDNSFTDRLHIDKIDYRLYPIVEEIAGRCDPDGFYHVRRDIARGYMFYLANSVSRQRNLALATDNSDAWAVMPYFIENANFSEQVWNPEAEGFYTSLIFNDIMPANIENIEVDQIINFVRTRCDERQQLRNVLNDFGSQLSQCSSASHLMTMRNDFQEKISQAKDNFKKSSSFINENLGYSIFVIGVPVALTIFAALGSSTNPYEPTRFLPSIFFGAIAAYLDFRRTKGTPRNDSYLSYLVDIDEGLILTHDIPSYWRPFEEFMND